MRRANITFLLFVCICPPTFADRGNEIVISDAWIGGAPAAASVLAAYATIKNNTTEPISLLSVSSPLFSRIEIHRSIVKNDMASMEKQDRLVIAAGEAIILSPGNYHLMLFAPASPLSKGDEADITFIFDNGHTESLSMKVKRRQDHKYPHHHH